MFRFVSSSTLKSRVVSQVSARSNFPAHNTNLNLRFNHSTTAPTPASELSSLSHSDDTSHLTFNTNNSNSKPNKRNNNPNNNNNRNPSNRNRNGNNRNKNIGAFDSPFFRTAQAFEECLSHTDTIQRDIHHNSPAIPTFWASIKRVMPLYRELIPTTELYEHRVSSLIHLLHTGLRLNRKELTSLGRKPDYDAKNFNREMTVYLAASLKEISNDILKKVVRVNGHGVLHLITSFKELNLDEDAVVFWDTGRSIEDIKFRFLEAKVLGAILPIAFELGKISYDDCKSLYDDTIALNNQGYPHPNLLCGMIKISLKAGHTKAALDYFASMSTHISRKDSGYLTDGHLSFISSCSDLGVAEAFFNKAIENKMPYRVELQVPSIKGFMNNVYNLTKDFKKVHEIWNQTITYYIQNNTTSNGILGSLNNEYLNIFFKDHVEFTANSFNNLKESIRVYNDLKSVDEPFLNSILTKCVVWEDEGVIQSLNEAYSLYNIDRSPIAHRIYLKALGSIDVTNEKIYEKWIELLNTTDSQGYTYIAAADWAALKDATIKSPNFSQERLQLYFKIFKNFSPFCQNRRQLLSIQKKDKDIDQCTELYNNINEINADDIVVPKFKSICVSSEY